jgi:hypothetical protein
MAAASSPSTQTPPDAQLEDNEDKNTDMPLTMAASVVLDQLPKDAHKALENAGELDQPKGIRPPCTTTRTLFAKHELIWQSSHDPTAALTKHTQFEAAAVQVLEQPTLRVHRAVFETEAGSQGP